MSTLAIAASVFYSGGGTSPPIHSGAISSAITPFASSLSGTSSVSGDDMSEISITLGTSTVSSTKVPAATARVSRVDVTVTTPYTAGTTLQIGQSGAVTLLAAAGDFLMTDTTGGTQTKFMDVAWGSALAALLTVTGASVGAAQVTIYYVDTVYT